MTELVYHSHTAQLLNKSRKRVWRIMGAYAKNKLHEQRGAVVGSGSTDGNRRTLKGQMLQTLPQFKTAQDA